MIGLEIHTYLVTREKLFCTCKASRERGTKPNTFICPICTGQPGAKPMLPNKEALEKTVQVGLLLGCTINPSVAWMRKHYDWPDSPKGYQTTISGAHAIPVGIDGTFEGIRISSMHLEEDPASWDPKTGSVDYNRAGLPIVEIVTAPDFTFAEEVVSWLGKLVHALSYLKVADSNAGIKVDVNVNIPGKTERVEIKNINSLDSIAKAIEYELERQSQEGSVRETRRYDETTGKTMSMRTKEAQDDYRFIADPDLPGVTIKDALVQQLQKQLPELPQQKLQKLITKYHVSERDATVLAKHLEIVEFFEEVAQQVDPSFALPWITVELLRVLNWNKTSLDKVSIKADHFVKLLQLVQSRKITELQAKQILNQFVPVSFSPSATEGKIDDERELEKVVRECMARNSKAVEDYKKGDSRSLNFLLGEVMKATNRRADSVVARKLLEKLLR